MLMRSKFVQKMLMQKHWDTMPAFSAALDTQPGQLLTTPCAECVNKAGGEHVKPEGGRWGEGWGTCCLAHGQEHGCAQMPTAH